MNRPVVICVSGLKNSGKTALIEALIPLLAKAGISTAVIKHHGHGFGDDIPDRPGTDTYRFLASGAYGTAIYDDTMLALVKRQSAGLEELIALFPESDLILVEGAKEACLPRIAMLRIGQSMEYCGDVHRSVPPEAANGNTERSVQAVSSDGDTKRAVPAVASAVASVCPQDNSLLCAVTDPDYDVSTLPDGLPRFNFGDFEAVAALIVNYLSSFEPCRVAAQTTDE